MHHIIVNGVLVMGIVDSIKNIFGNKVDVKVSPQVQVSKNPQSIIQPVPFENNLYSVLVIYWISKKKNGYEKRSNSFPKWFLESYFIDFNNTLNHYLSKNFLLETNDIITVTELGKQEMKDKDYIILLKEHSYGLSAEDFINSPNLHKVKNNDIVWGKLNERILTYTQQKMWNSLQNNYYDMAYLLIEENKYEQALDFIFASTFIQASGMTDNNELNYMKSKLLPNGCPDIPMLDLSNYTVTIPLNTINKKINLSDDEIHTRFVNSELVDSLIKLLPFHYFEKEEVCKFMLSAFHANGKKGIFRLNDMKEKLKYNKPNPNSSLYFYNSIENKIKELYK